MHFSITTMILLNVNRNGRISTHTMVLDHVLIGCNNTTIETGQCGSNWEAEPLFNPVQVDWRMVHRCGGD